MSTTILHATDMLIGRLLYKRPSDCYRISLQRFHCLTTGTCFLCSNRKSLLVFVQKGKHKIQLSFCHLFFPVILSLLSRISKILFLILDSVLFLFVYVHTSLRRNDMFTYVLSLYTGDQTFAGTTNNISIRLHGAEGSSQEITIGGWLFTKVS